MGINNIKNVSGFITFISENSSWSPVTVSNVISALGYRKNDGMESLKGLSSNLVDCAKNGANTGFTGFTMYCETVKFFQENRGDIVRNIELSAKIIGRDTVKMVQSFGIYRREKPPAPEQIKRALLDTSKIHDDLTDLYNVFAWFCLEDVSNIWYMYLYNNTSLYAALTA
jgi:hypothetical protein